MKYETAAALAKFREDRQWTKYHTPKELAAAIAIEAGELQKEFLWRQDGFNIDRVKEEMADIMIFLHYLSVAVPCDLEYEVLQKIKKNAAKYPVEKSINKW